MPFQRIKKISYMMKTFERLTRNIKNSHSFSRRRVMGEAFVFIKFATNKLIRVNALTSTVNHIVKQMMRYALRKVKLNYILEKSVI